MQVLNINGVLEIGNDNSSTRQWRNREEKHWTKLQQFNRFVFTNDTVLASLQNQSTAVFNH